MLFREGCTLEIPRLGCVRVIFHRKSPANIYHRQLFSFLFIFHTFSFAGIFFFIMFPLLNVSAIHKYPPTFPLLIPGVCRRYLHRPSIGAEHGGIIGMDASGYHPSMIAQSLILRFHFDSTFLC